MGKTGRDTTAWLPILLNQLKELTEIITSLPRGEALSWSRRWFPSCALRGRQSGLFSHRRQERPVWAWLDIEIPASFLLAPLRNCSIGSSSALTIENKSPIRAPERE